MATKPKRIYRTRNVYIQWYRERTLSKHSGTPEKSGFSVMWWEPYIQVSWEAACNFKRFVLRLGKFTKPSIWFMCCLLTILTMCWSIHGYSPGCFTVFIPTHIINTTSSLCICSHTTSLNFSSPLLFLLHDCSVQHKIARNCSSNREQYWKPYYNMHNKLLIN